MRTFVIVFKPVQRHDAFSAGGLHNRAEHAERAARHWQSLWEESFRNLGSMLLDLEG